MSYDPDDFRWFIPGRGHQVAQFCHRAGGRASRAPRDYEARGGRTPPRPNAGAIPYTSKKCRACTARCASLHLQKHLARAMLFR
jgi:hypothetical protein